MWYENLHNHYKIKLIWTSAAGEGLELIIVKKDKQVNYNNVLHEDADGRIWIEKSQEARTNPIVQVGKILWCMGCKINVLIRPLYFNSCLKNINLSIHKADKTIETICIDEKTFCSRAKLPVCEIIIPRNINGIPTIIKMR